MRFFIFAVAAICSFAQAEVRASEPSETAIQLSRGVVVGIKIGVEVRELGEMEIAPDTAACVRAIDEKALVPVYEKLMRQRMSAEDIRTLDEFYGSEFGRRYIRWSVNSLRTENKLPILDLVDFTKDDQDRAVAFHGHGPGKILAEMGVGADEAGKQEIDAAIERTVKPCVPVK